MIGSSLSSLLAFRTIFMDPFSGTSPSWAALYLSGLGPMWNIPSEHLQAASLLRGGGPSSVVPNLPGSPGGTADHCFF